MKKYVKLIPFYGIIPLLTCFLVNDIVYFILRLFMEGAYHYDLTTSFDRMIPFVPAWVSIYFICYIFWIVNYLLIAAQSKEHLYRFVVADILSRLICGVFFVILPTTNVRPEVVGNGIWENLMRWLYAIDAPTNLFPSIHCLTSWFCYIGIRGQKKVPKWYQIFSLIFALLVCLSTQFTKQHYLVDVIGGIGLAQLCYWIAMKFDWYKPVMVFFEGVNERIRRLITSTGKKHGK
ncbi:phosphatase PAP2 family protein [Fusibacillus kribbianus]|uniref:Phosphatase PAP2 family protein n=1 Tax=Fusibacillus kribbianus TaxID=3044208 RepID=A0AAP4B9Z4_9FIRM|nr:phosphatase PAP2 family protein [Ruminococcus sp. YH-rum2234]MDI9241403.1 phosphatase PAP2 family protein [Ruminococcus sp. YH-rum2234]